MPFELAVKSIEAIKAHTEIHPKLTEWASFSYAIDGVLNGLIVSAKKAIALIDTELEEGE